MSKVTSSTGQKAPAIQPNPVSQQSGQIEESKNPPQSSSTPSTSQPQKASQQEVRNRVSEYQIGGQARQAELQSKLSANKEGSTLYGMGTVAASTVKVMSTNEPEDYSGSTGGEEEGPPPGTFDNTDWVTKGDSEPESEALRAELMVQKDTEKLNDMLVRALNDVKEAEESSKKAAEEAATARAEAVQDPMDRNDKRGAIKAAIENYNIDTSSINGSPRYGKTLGRLEGQTFGDGTVRIGEAAFKSPGWLASSIGHEAQHADQIAEGRWHTPTNDPQAIAINEVECYDWELSNATRNGLTEGEIKTVKGRRDDEMAKLDPTYKLKVLGGDYSWP